MAQAESSYTVDPYVRSLTAGDNHARIEETLTRLNEQQSTGIIDDYTIHVWGRASASPRRSPT